ncbi:hypothetical protein SIN8267_00564 [Sinobacterium norvegicum]|uniref:YgjP-like metallopeptidase domain-containing protein n=1 Tax=Sinobacterium norvegicum TaxID=1641715 RepID=A0ABM9AB90_9GAMM|nr:SprT family zinc-dependent metalloprotease [Sinobacterium norvegicum]CAH0990472.1 hypothetical protein SIN8267_00564 [Sinobacterium norvegicum]
MDGFIDYQIKLMRRKTIGIYILPDGVVEVRAPKRTTRQSIATFVAGNRQWIEQRMALAEQRKGRPFNVFGRPRQVLVELGQRRYIRLSARQLRIVILPGDDDEAMRQQLKAWLLVIARRYLARRLVANLDWCHVLRVDKPELRVRYMRSRWGSCSLSGRVNLSTTLVQLPVEFCDYVIAHELCHLRVFNHSPRFYQLMQVLQPDWRLKREYLKQIETGVEVMQIKSYLHR